MTIKIKSLTGRVFEINYTNKITIMEIKEQIQQLDGIGINQIRIIYEGKLLNDDIILNESYNNKILHMVLSLR